MKIVTATLKIVKADTAELNEHHSAPESSRS